LREASDLDPTTEGACVRRAAEGDGRWRHAAASGGAAHEIELGGSASCASGARMKRERRGFHLGWCGRRRRDGDDAQRGGVAVNSGDGYWATRCAGTSTSGTGGLLTSVRDSWVASRRRSGGEGEESTRWRLGFPAALESKRRRLGCFRWLG
jgi:hypothetical protein